MSEKIISDMKREIDSIIKWIVDLKVQQLQDKIQEGYDAIAENKKLKDKEFKYKMQIKNLQSYLRNIVDTKDYLEDSFGFITAAYDNDGYYWLAKASRREEFELPKFLLDNIDPNA